MSTGWIVLGVIVIIVLFAFAAYNRLVALGQRVTRPSPTSTCSSSSATTDSEPGRNRKGLCRA